jgi:hypothetical protein
MTEKIEAMSKVTLGEGLHLLSGVSSGSLTMFCARHGIRSLLVFGSYARGEQKPESDLDILVQFQPEHTPDFLAMVAMEMELNQLTGRRVDFRTPEEISRYVRDRVLAEAKAVIVC